MEILFDWSTRASKRVRGQGADLAELASRLAAQEHDPSWIAGKVKTRPDEGVQVYGTFWTPTPTGGGFADATCPTCGAPYTAAYGTPALCASVAFNCQLFQWH